MQKIVIVSIGLVILLGSCKPPTLPVPDLLVIDYKYYIKESKKLFTGIAITKYKNGVISNSTEFKGGVPSGNWFAYGYKGEVIQEGKFIPLQLEDSLMAQKNITRYNIGFWKEGDHSFIDGPFLYEWG